MEPACAYTYTCTHTHMHTCTRTYTHMYTHIHIHTHAHTHACTHRLFAAYPEPNSFQQRGPAPGVHAGWTARGLSLLVLAAPPTPPPSLHPRLGYGHLCLLHSASPLSPEHSYPHTEMGREGAGPPPSPAPEPHPHTQPAAPLRTQPPRPRGLRLSEQLSYKSAFIGVPRCNRPCITSESAERDSEEQREEPPRSGKAAHNQPDLVKRCNRWLSEIIYSC